MSAATEKRDGELTVEIDGRTCAAHKGQMLIEVADANGIDIPRFCYHPELSIASSCRMCLVDVEKAPKPLPACSTPVMDGMKVATRSERAVNAQRGVMEFLLINHPLDCPICDQGGECELQDVAIGYGRCASRYVEAKRVQTAEDVGPLISTAMNRCIHCTRCVRFLSEIAGSEELGGIGRGDRTLISTFISGSIDSELSANVIDLCPVGALTNRPFRYRARSWEMSSGAARSNHDALGSHTRVHIRNGEILRVVPRVNPKVNGSWLSDRDRFSYQGLYSDDRLQVPMVRKEGALQETTWPDALQRAGLLLSDSDAKAGLIAPNASNEEFYLFQALLRGLGSSNLDHRLRQSDFADQQTARPGMAVQMADVENADALLLIGSNVRHDQPLLGYRVRRAWQAGAAIMAVNPYDYDFNFELSSRVVVKPSQMVERLAAVAAALELTSGIDAVDQLIKSHSTDDQSKAIADTLRSAEHGVIMLGNQAAWHHDASWLRVLARTIAEGSGSALNIIPDGANSVGAWRMGAVPHIQADGSSTAGNNTGQILADTGGALMMFGIEPEQDLADSDGMAAAMARVETVIACTAYTTPLLEQHAEVLLPIACGAEIEGSYSNADGDTDKVGAAVNPPGSARQGWQVLRALAGECHLEEVDCACLEQLQKEIAGFEPVLSGGESEVSQRSSADLHETFYDLPIYAVDAQVRRSPSLQQTALAQDVLVSPAASDDRAAEGSRRIVLGVPGIEVEAE